MMKRRLMLVGLDGAGKSTLADVIEGSTCDHSNREDCCYRARTFEVPGRYVENHWMHNVILMLAHNQAKVMALLIDGTTCETYYSTGYVRALTIDCLGVLTKTSRLAAEERKKGLQRLRNAGCTEVLCVSTETGEGIEEFKAWVDQRLPCVQAC